MRHTSPSRQSFLLAHMTVHLPSLQRYPERHCCPLVWAAAGTPPPSLSPAAESQSPNDLYWQVRRPWTRVSTPESAIRWTDSTQRTGAVTWLSSSSTMRPGSVFGSAVTLATIGAEGCLNVTAARTWASRGCTGAISEQWKGALTGRGTARFAPFSLHFAIARSTAAACPAITVCSGEL